ncbi:MAG: 30S ribosomal protein S5 [Candidatus Shikimatogenerans sp. Tcar]|uniref:Small ribosomal subunit protein uS5 n=1 Tax=Candidatus Shikimatogenerans sp. Tcar TaxID=3158565 RepID=A0AAU7QRN6_9FLAO
MIEKIIKINKVCKVTKGRRCYSFNTFIVKGNKKGLISYGLGKSKEILDSIKKASIKCDNNFFKIYMINNTIPYNIKGKFKKSIIKMYPAKKGTGIVAHKYIKLLFECLGIKNIYTKLIGSNNSHNIIKATILALKKINSLKNISNNRNISINKIINYDNKYIK